MGRTRELEQQAGEAKPEPIYLDYAATTPVRREVLEAMEPCYGPRFGNPSSVHRWGREARALLDGARERLARCIGADPAEICFTSGGTEADNLAVLGAWRARRDQRRRAVLSTPIEHKAVLAAVQRTADEGAETRLAPVTPDGVVDVAEFERLLDEQVAVCSVMWVNNELGTIQPVEQLAAMAKARGAVVHSDAVQAFGKIAIDVTKVPVDLLAISGHKIGAPKGVGALYVRRGTAVSPLLVGGGQEQGRRPGTENVAFAVALARAAELAVAEREAEAARLGALRDRLEATLAARIPEIVIHGRGAPRAPHVLNVSVPGTAAGALLLALDLAGVAVSGGSACQSGSGTASHVITALGVEPSIADAAIRLSLGRTTTAAEVERVAEIFVAVVGRLRRRTPAPVS